MKHGSKLNRQEVVERYKNGESVISIAENCGVSRQTVYLALGDAVKKDGRHRRKSKAVVNTPYVNLKAYLQRRDTPNLTDFVRSVFGSANEYSFPRFRRILEGGEQSGITIQNIRRMEQITGMTFDQIFFREDEPRDDF